jgi:hypothetical protein
LDHGEDVSGKLVVAASDTAELLHAGQCAKTFIQLNDISRAHASGFRKARSPEQQV